MKILFCVLNMGKGGAERVISILANNFSKENVNVSVLMLRKNNIDYNLDKKIKLLSVDKQSKNKLKTLLSKVSIFKLYKMLNIIKTENPDVMVCFLPEPSLKTLLLKLIDKKIKKIPIIVSVRNDPVREYSNKIIYSVMKYLYNKADMLVLQTNQAYEYFAKIIDKSKLIVIPNPIDDKFLVEEPYEGKRENNIVTVGRLTAQKNQKLLINAFKIVSTKYSDLKLLIYGAGELENELKKYTEGLDLKDKIIFKGQTNDVKKEIYNAKMFVLSSDYEGMPNALMEALALGVPCISTDCPCGGPRMLIENNKTGILVPVNDVHAMANAIFDLLEKEEKAKQMSNLAVISTKKYQTSLIFNLWSDIIKTIIR